VISLKLIPRKILNAIEFIRKIRNVFAHNLNINTLLKKQENLILTLFQNYMIR